MQTFNVDWYDVLTEAGVGLNGFGDQFTLPCPFHSDSRPSLAINTERGLWICYAGCGQGSLKYFLSRYLDISNTEVDSYINKRYNIFNIDNIFEDNIDNKEEELLEVEFPYESGYVPKWIFDRGFNIETLDKWDCAVGEDNSLVIPVKTKDRKIVGWVSRRLYASPKYMYSKGLKCSKLLFGHEHIQSTPFVCVTEGTLDTMWLDQHGYPSVAIFGASMSKQQQELLLSLPTQEIVLCLDNDSAGQIATNKALTALNQRCIVSVIKIPGGYKDVQDVKEAKVLQEILQTRSLW